MSIPVLPSPAPTSTPRRRRRGVRAGLAAVATGSLLVAVVGWAAPAGTATTATDQLTIGRTAPGQSQTWGSDPGSWSGEGWSGGAASGSGGGWSGGSTSSGTSTATVDSDPASAAEQQGVALIDTVLTNGEAAGTGIVLTSDGEVLTNYHVVEGSTSIRVTIASTGTTYTASVVGADPEADVALLQLTGASGLTAARIDDDTLAVGDDVTAVGNAGGTGTLTAADGEVTSLSSTITTAAEDGTAGETLQDLIETDADVVSGDSGGPLVDEEGEVVGIDTAASTGSEIDGYAIPIDDALVIVAQIRSGDETADVRIGAAAFLGVELAAGYGTGSSGAGTSGATIAGVLADGAAEEAGLSAGDTITGVGTTAIDDADDLTAALGTREPGGEVTLHWTTTDGSQRSATVTLGSNPVN